MRRGVRQADNEIAGVNLDLDLTLISDSVMVEQLHALTLEAPGHYDQVLPSWPGFFVRFRKR
jgi:hypothetical protein